MLRSILLLACVCISGCATLLQSDTQLMRLTSAPAGATVLINGESRGVTPAEVSLRPTKTYTLVLRKEGYVDFTTQLTPVTGFESWGPLAYPARHHNQTMHIWLQPVGEGGRP